jgi:hypothetical protein
MLNNEEGRPTPLTAAPPVPFPAAGHASFLAATFLYLLGDLCCCPIGGRAADSAVRPGQEPDEALDRALRRMAVGRRDVDVRYAVTSGSR